MIDQCSFRMEATIVKHGRRSMGYGFVLFDTVDDVDKAKSQLDKAELEGRQINVEAAKTNQSIWSPSRRRRNRRRRSSARTTNSTEKSTHDDDDGDDQQQQQQHSKPRRRRRPRRQSSRPHDDIRRKSEPSKTMVFVANIPYATSDEELQELFKDYKVASAQVARARSGRSKGYAFVDLASQDEQQRALEEIKDVELDGRIIYLKPAMSSSSPIAATETSTNNKDHDKEKSTAAEAAAEAAAAAGSQNETGNEEGTSTTEKENKE